MAISFRTFAVQPLSNRTTTTTITIPTVSAGEDLYVLAVSRDHTAGTAKYTCTDDDTGGNTWTEKAISSDRKTTLFWKKATANTSAKVITIATTVGSVSSGLCVISGAASGDPTTNIVLEENASGNEAHASFTPDNANSLVLIGITNDTNDIAVTSVAGATMGALTQGWEKLNTGGSDCSATVWSKVLASGATGAFSWSQDDGTTDSITWAVKEATTTTTTTTAAPTTTTTTSTSTSTTTTTTTMAPFIAQIIIF